LLQEVCTGGGDGGIVFGLLLEARALALALAAGWFDVLRRLAVSAITALRRNIDNDLLAQQVDRFRRECLVARHTRDSRMPLITSPSRGRDHRGQKDKFAIRTENFG
jgi:hypothetical protein